MVTMVTVADSADAADKSFRALGLQSIQPLFFRFFPFSPGNPSRSEKSGQGCLLLRNPDEVVPLRWFGIGALLAVKFGAWLWLIQPPLDTSWRD